MIVTLPTHKCYLDILHRVVANKFFRVPSVEGGGDQWVEWAYAFDVHLNGFFSLMVMLHGVQLVLVWGECAGVGWGECAGVGWE